MLKLLSMSPVHLSSYNQSVCVQVSEAVLDVAVRRFIPDPAVSELFRVNAAHEFISATCEISSSFQALTSAKEHAWTYHLAIALIKVNSP